MFILYPELYPWLCLPQSLIHILANMPCIGCISCIANFAIKMLAEFVQKNPNTKIAKYLKIRDCSNRITHPIVNGEVMSPILGTNRVITKDVKISWPKTVATHYQAKLKFSDKSRAIVDILVLLDILRRYFSLHVT